MHPDNQAQLESRVIRAAEEALAKRKFVTAIDVFTGMGLLSPQQAEAWRKGRIDYLERVIQGNLKKISFSMYTFRRWAAAKGLRPSETRYVRAGRGGQVDLRFSKSGDESVERLYRTHYVSPELAERKQQTLKDRYERSTKPVVFLNLRASQCAECSVEIPPDGFLMMENQQPLCLACAGFGDLEFLPAGDTALTRRAGKHSARSAVVVRFSRSRGRYERQGILVEEAALEKAEQECFEDADARARARVRAAALRQEQDRQLIARMTKRLLELYPRCPEREAQAIARHTAERGSGRVGRTEAGRNLDARALDLAVAAAVRHNHTDYDMLLAQGVERAEARARVAGRVQEVLDGWSA